MPNALVRWNEQAHQPMITSKLPKWNTGLPDRQQPRLVGAADERVAELVVAIRHQVPPPIATTTGAASQKIFANSSPRRPSGPPGALGDGQGKRLQNQRLPAGGPD